MRRILFIAVLFAIVACGRQSSPEGRSILRDEQIQAQLNLLKEQNKAILDSITVFRHELDSIKQR